MDTKTRIEGIGFDMGNTIVNLKVRDAFPDALRVIKRLVKERFGEENSHIVSRVTPRQEVRAREWLQATDFCSRTGISMDNVHFCLERADKGVICEKIRLTHFIDDRPEVMIHMPNMVTKRILFNPTPEDIKEFGPQLPNALIARCWTDVEALLLR